MNNAGIGPKGTSWKGLDNWHKIFEVNVFGCVSRLDSSHVVAEWFCCALHIRVVNVQQTFVPVRCFLLLPFGCQRLIISFIEYG
jgi:hypothetical protein